jgi:carbonic anhydrase
MRHFRNPYNWDEIQMRRLIDQMMAWVLGVIVSTSAVSAIMYGITLWAENLQKNRITHALYQDSQTNLNQNSADTDYPADELNSLIAPNSMTGQPDSHTRHTTGSETTAGVACEYGHQQSPIDIALAQRDRNLRPIVLNFRHSIFDIVKKDDLLRLVPRKNNNKIKLEGDYYTLKYLTFRTPSEHMFNGEQFEAEIQFTTESGDGHLIQVAVLVRAGSKSSWTDKLVAQLLSNDIQIVDTVSLNPRLLVPNDHSYFTYMGSLTDRPCSEDIKWIIFQRHLLIGVDDLDVIRSSVGSPSRALQDRHKREIKSFKR